MKKLMLIMFSLSVLISCSSMPNKNQSWSTDDTSREIAFQVINIVDLGQTLNIVENDDYVELNPLLGKHPTKKEVYNYFALSGLTHYLISRNLSKSNRSAWQYVTFGISLGAVGHNYRIGLKVSF